MALGFNDSDAVSMVLMLEVWLMGMCCVVGIAVCENA